MSYSPFRHLPSVIWKRRPIQLTFFVTRRCNARCDFCFYLNGEDRRQTHAGEFSLEEVERTASSLGPLLWLAFSGGEPYLRKDLLELSRAFYARNRPSIILYSTNGLLTKAIAESTEQIVSHCRRSTVVVKVSLHGVGEEHDRICNTPGSFQKAMRTYALLSRLSERYPNFELGINTVMLADNQDKMGELREFVRGLPNLHAHTISLVRGPAADCGREAIDPASYHQAAAQLEDALAARTTPTYRFNGGRLKAAQDILQRSMIYRTLVERRRQTPCYAGRLNLVLAEDGELFACEMLPQSLGNLREHDYDVRRVLESPRAREIIESIRQESCYCTHECYFITNVLFNPRLYPALAREYVRL